MKIQSLNSGFIMPTKGTGAAGAFDIYMPEGGRVAGDHTVIGLGFATEVPKFHIALIVPRSGIGAKYGLELNNTAGVIDADYRGEWKAALRTKNGEPFSWDRGDRILQFLIIPVNSPELELVESVEKTERGEGGFGSTGK